jgi:hypothetical protein
LGQSYANKMTESAQRLLDLAKSFPQIGQALDLIIQDLGIPNAARYAERLRPPGFHSGDEDGPTAAELQQQVQLQEQNLQQADQLIQKLLAKVNELGDIQTTKRLEIASKERIAAASDRAEIMAADAKAGHAGNLAVLQARLEAILHALETETPEPTAVTQAAEAAQQPAQPTQPAAPTPTPAGPTGLNAGAPMPGPQGPGPTQ